MRVTNGMRPAVRIGTRRTAEPEYGDLCYGLRNLD